MKRGTTVQTTHHTRTRKTAHTVTTTSGRTRRIKLPRPSRRQDIRRALAEQGVTR